MLLTDQIIVSEKPQEKSYVPYVTMVDLIDKLRFLNFDTEFTRKMKMKPIHKHYFVVPKNPGEQFYLFCSLAAWLIRKSGRLFEQPQESDDPNSTISNILDVLRENGIIADFSPSKLKQGVGEHVVFVLDHLANLALKHVNFVKKKVIPPQEEEEQAQEVEDEAEIVLDKVEEEMMALYSEESDDENMFHISDVGVKKPEQNLEFATNVDQEVWKLELERVLPQLKVTVKNDNRDWRAHLEQMKALEETMNANLNGTKAQLEKTHKDISGALEKISSREKYLNRDLENVLDEYRILQDQLSKVQDTYKNISGGVTERNRELTKLTDQLETIKQQMEERGSSMTDGTPLVNIKKAIARIKNEITEMDVRIGVLECILLQSKLQDKKILDEDLRQSTHIM